MTTLNIYSTRDIKSKSWQVFSPFQLKWDGDVLHEYNGVYHGSENSYGLFWGLGGYNKELILKHTENCHRFYFSDMPYFGRFNPNKPDDECYWRIILNGLHVKYSQYMTITKLITDKRFKKHKIKMKPRNINGSDILICPSSNTMTRYYTSFNTAEEWVLDITKKISKQTDRKIRVRYKPRANGTSGPHVAKIPFEEDVKNVYAVVTLASMAGIEAIINGVPCISMHGPSPINYSLDNLMFDEEENYKLMCYLSYNQFTPKEIQSGEALEILNFIKIHTPFV